MSSDCGRAATIMDEARVLASQHRALRAQLYRERATTLCPERASEPQVETASDDGKFLEEVYRSPAGRDARLALSANRFQDEPLAQQLDHAVLALSPQVPPAVVPIAAYNTTPATILGDWVSLTADSLSRKGEWFERYASLPAGLLCGPFLDRVMLLGRGLDRDRSCVVYDLVAGKQLFELLETSFKKRGLAIVSSAGMSLRSNPENWSSSVGTIRGLRDRNPALERDLLHVLLQNRA